jgi:hypothetical protein
MSGCGLTSAALALLVLVAGETRLVPPDVVRLPACPPDLEQRRASCLRPSVPFVITSFKPIALSAGRTLACRRGRGRKPSSPSCFAQRVSGVPVEALFNLALR